MFAKLIPESVAAGSLVTLAVGLAVLASLGYLTAARLRSPAWQRAVWQMVLLAMAGLTGAELAGLSSCISHLVGMHLRENSAQGKPAVSAANNHRTAVAMPVPAVRKMAMSVTPP